MIRSAVVSVRDPCGIGVGSADAEKRRLGFRVLAQLAHLVVLADFGPLLFSLILSLGFIALLLLPGLFLLAFRKR
ncbi:MAG TPA: hypothetical protein VMH85_14025 [Terriglobales bacterium]|nr:hypothetical protein [Terriglobales bacterium]